MKRISYFWLAGAALVLAITLLAPGEGPALEKRGMGHMIQKEQVAKDLGLTPEKTEAFLAVGETYEKNRQEIIEKIKKSEDELEKALAAPKPDEAMISSLVASITTDHNSLWGSIRAQRQQEMALLTPMQQGKFLMALKKWHRDMCLKFEKQQK